VRELAPAFGSDDNDDEPPHSKEPDDGREATSLGAPCRARPTG
jgi:hypothetical protein